MSKCDGCKTKDKEIDRLNDLVSFHACESFSWRQLWNEQRGGDEYDALQKRYAALKAVERK